MKVTTKIIIIFLAFFILISAFQYLFLKTEIQTSFGGYFRGRGHIRGILEERFLITVNKTLFYSILFSFLLAIGLAAYIGNLVSKKTGELNWILKEISRGNLSLKAREGPDEFGTIAKRINQMVVSLKEQDELRKDMITFVSHELVTPVFLLKGNLEALEDGLIDREDALRNIKHALERIEEKIKELREISLLESQELSLKKDHINLKDLFLKILEYLNGKILEKNLIVTTNLFDKVIYGDPGKMEEAIKNIIENAIVYNKEGGMININFTEEDRFSITIEDTGIGMDLKELSELPRKFYRGKEGALVRPEGLGIGLFYAHKILEAHSFKMSINSQKDKGTKITLIYN